MRLTPEYEEAYTPIKKRDSWGAEKRDTEELRELSSRRVRVEVGRAFLMAKAEVEDRLALKEQLRDLQVELLGR